MITSKPIKDGSSYLGNHLRKNDYWTEGEKQVEGLWLGTAAEMLNIAACDFDEAFEALRTNQHPVTGGKLTPREKENRTAFHDIQISAPKDVSVLAVVGGDERVRQAFHEASTSAVKELEKLAAVRDRQGDKAHLDENRITGNIVAALFQHDSSRDLDPQLHAHAVTANLTWDQKTNSWKALQASEMLRASKYVRQTMYQDLAQRLEKLGYETHSHGIDGFEIKGIEHLRDRFSKRRDQIEVLKDEFREREKREPTGKEVDVMVRESRSAKMAEISTDSVRDAQLAQLTEEERNQLTELVGSAKPGNSPPLPRVSAKKAVGKGIDHVFERSSVARESEVLAAAYELAGGMIVGDVWEAMRSHPDYLADKHSGQMTLHSIKAEETRALDFAREGLNTRTTLGNPNKLTDWLDIAAKKFGVSQNEQRKAGEILCSSKDAVSVLIGDAGTGKTFLLKTVRDAHLVNGGQNFVALGPTGRARDELKKEGFDEAQTVQRFLVDARWQGTVKNRVLLVDEAGMLSTKQMGKLVEVAERNGNRLILVGDTKQHEAVERGNALRNLVEGAKLPVARLSSVKRQKDEVQRRISELLGAGKLVEGLALQDKHGMVFEQCDEEKLFEQAARSYAESIEAGKETIVVIPVWSEIHVFNEKARDELKQRGMIHGEETGRESVVSCSWTEAEKTAWHKYQPGHVLTFHKDTAKAGKGESLEVIEGQKSGLRCKRQDGTEVAVTRKQRMAFDVGEVSKITLAAGDKVMFRANSKELGYSNGEVAKVSSVENGRVILSNGRELPTSFKGISYGHAVTSHKSQGASVEAAMLVMGHKSTSIANARQFYVSNTRHKQRHQLFVADKVMLGSRLAKGSRERELAREYLKRTGFLSSPALPTAKRLRRRVRAAVVRFRSAIVHHRVRSSLLRVGMSLTRLVKGLGRHVPTERLRQQMARKTASHKHHYPQTRQPKL